MNLKLSVRLFGLGLIFADLFFMLYLYQSAMLAEYTMSQFAHAIGTLSTQLQSNNDSSEYVTLFISKSFTEALQYLGNYSIWVYLILLFGLLLILAPQWFVRLLQLGDTREAAGYKDGSI